MTAIAPLTPSRFGTSTQPSLHGASMTSMADNLPSVDFGYDELRERMAAFTSRFDEFIAKGRKRVLDERNAFRMSAAEVHETQRVRRQAITDLEHKSTSHAYTVEKEAQETYELQTAIESLRQEKEKQEQRRVELQHTVQTVQSDIKQRKDAQTVHQQALDAQAREDIPELRAWETLLDLRIEGAEADTEKLRFIFNGIDSKDMSREAWFEMDFARQEGMIISTKPQLPKADIARLEQSIGKDRDIGTLLRGMRELLTKASKG